MYIVSSECFLKLAAVFFHQKGITYDKLLIGFFKLEEMKEKVLQLNTQGLWKGGAEVKKFCPRKEQREGSKQEKSILKYAN